MIALDTSAYSNLNRGGRRVADLVLNSEQILLPSFVEAELRFGFAFGSKELENNKLLDRFIASSKVRLVLPDKATTLVFTELAKLARQSGVQLSSHDLWIAALAKQFNASLVTYDKDFANLPSGVVKIDLLKVAS